MSILIQYSEEHPRAPVRIKIPKFLYTHFFHLSPQTLLLDTKRNASTSAIFSSQRQAGCLPLQKVSPYGQELDQPDPCLQRKGCRNQTAVRTEQVHCRPCTATARPPTYRGTARQIPTPGSNHSSKETRWDYVRQKRSSKRGKVEQLHEHRLISSPSHLLYLLYTPRQITLYSIIITLSERVTVIFCLSFFLFPNVYFHRRGSSGGLPRVLQWYGNQRFCIFVDPFLLTSQTSRSLIWSPFWISS